MHFRVSSYYDSKLGGLTIFVDVVVLLVKGSRAIALALLLSESSSTVDFALRLRPGTLEFVTSAFINIVRRCAVTDIPRVCE